MYRIFTYASLMVFAVLLPVSAAGDKKKDAGGFPPVERGPEHKVLASLVGAWDAKVKLYLDPTKPMESAGVMNRSMILGGNFLQESFKGEFIGKNFAGLGIIGFDANKKKFVTNWCDSMSTSMTTTHGTYDPIKKTLTSLGQEHDANTKKQMKVRDVLRIISADEQVLEMYRQPDGAPNEFKVMEITYKRRKVEKK